MAAAKPAPLTFPDGDRHPPRPLGGNEKAFWRLDEASCLNFAVVAHVRPGLDATRVRAALDGLQARHPLLRAHIALRDGTPWFEWPVEVPPIELAQHAIDRDAWPAFFEAELRRGLRWRRAPLARAILLDHGARGESLALFLHHSIGDGRSAVAAMRDLLWEATAGKPWSPTVFERSVACEQALPAKVRGLGGTARRAKLLAQLIAEGARYRDRLKCPVLHPAAPHERTYHIEPRVFDVATTTALATRARAEQSTVHGAIGAAMLLAMARLAGVDRERAVVFGSPIDVRAQLEPPVGDQLGMYLAASQYVARIGPETRFWAIARGIRDRIVRDVEGGRALDALPLVGLFYGSLGGDKGSPEEFGRRWAATNGTTGVTNLGRIDVLAPPGLTIERIHTVAAPSGLDIFNGFASSYGGSLQVSFNWPEPCFDRPGALALVDDIWATLGAGITGDPALRGR
ncbi:MAG: hypothetical protein K8W52_14355 [Deltaproteobacteria bacterium]|nr:hypothetical protein [Deltaproteobacteria bacterium]